MMESTPSPVDKLICDLTGKAKPRICFLATASGDLPWVAHAFDEDVRVFKHL